MFDIEIDGVSLTVFTDSDGYMTDLYAGEVNIAPMLDTLFGGNQALHDKLQALVDAAADKHYKAIADDIKIDAAIDRLTYR